LNKSNYSYFALEF